MPSLGEYYIVDFEKTSDRLAENEKRVLIKLLGLNEESFEEGDFIEFTKLAYEVAYKSESTCYIFFKTNKGGELTSILTGGNATIKRSRENEYVYEYICFHTAGTDFMMIEIIVNNHYKWWEDNEKMINKAEIYQ